MVTTENRYYGHVALVEKVNGDTITVSEMNYVGGEKRVDGLFRLRVEQSRVSSIDFLGILSIFSFRIGRGTSGLYGHQRSFFFVSFGLYCG
jgi:surface antigen